MACMLERLNPLAAEFVLRRLLPNDTRCCRAAAISRDARDFRRGDPAVAHGSNVKLSVIPQILRPPLEARSSSSCRRAADREEAHIGSGRGNNIRTAWSSEAGAVPRGRASVLSRLPRW